MKLNILTFDIEDWFHINDSTWVPHQQWSGLDARVSKNTDSILQLLQSHDIKATFFVMGWIAEIYPDLVSKIDAAGHDIGYHSYYHMRPLHQSERDYTNDLTSGTDVISAITGKKVRIYRAPNLSLDQHTAWIIPILLEHGITVSSSTKAGRIIYGQPIPNKPFYWQTKEGQLPEFPLNRLLSPLFPLTFTGSGYFRLFPFSMTNFLYKTHNYNNGYFHPNDIDPEVPTPPELGLIRNWLNTVGSSTALYKLDKLLHNHAFLSIEAALSNIDQTDLPIIQLPHP